MRKDNNHYQVSCFVYYMANAWCHEESVRIFGKNLGDHFWSKWANYNERYQSADAATMKLYYDMSDHYRDDLVSAAIEHYKDGTWIDNQ